ncbi:MAG TPA: hypothetical protein VNM67_24750 [Thermoanaerobaculia bacterium]|jgi:hypothetical protein|nr:hypothetical protein [Thermoanaerobaculia bacterium]
MLPPGGPDERALEAQHLADVALMNVAHQARMRTLEDLWRSTGAGAGQPQTPTVPATVPARAPAPKPKRERFSLLNDLEDALPGLPETFDKRDIVRALGYEPPHASLHRTLRTLQSDGRIAIMDNGFSGTINRYRKL